MFVLRGVVLVHVVILVFCPFDTRATGLFAAATIDDFRAVSGHALQFGNELLGGGYRGIIGHHGLAGLI